MWRRLLPLLLVTAPIGCGAGNQPDNRTSGAGPMDNAALAKLDLTSGAFADGRPIPVEYSCDGANQSPALSWDEPPPGTKSFALVIDDPDAPSGTFRHWGVYDIPASARAIDAGQRIGTEVKNDKGTPGYTGPCPPPGHGVHHYHFKLFALDVDRLNLGTEARVADVETEAAKHAIAQVELVGTFERK
jgi:Raf kinase inhibitor-like YbhB/YbcL family protein